MRSKWRLESNDGALPDGAPVMVLAPGRNRREEGRFKPLRRPGLPSAQRSADKIVSRTSKNEAAKLGSDGGDARWRCKVAMQGSGAR